MDVTEDKAELYQAQAAARAEWDEIGELPLGERDSAADLWAAKYRELFLWYRSFPVFGGQDAE